MDHDQNFKNLIVDYPRESLQFFAADEAAGVDARARIIPIREEQLKERLGERFRELDVPLLVEWPDGRREALLFVLEEETESRRFSIHRLAHYCLVQFVDIYAALSDAEREHYQRDYPEETKAMVSFQTRFEQIGEQRGKQIGEATMLLRLLEGKFGTVSDQQRRRILAADADTLLDWLDRTFTAADVDEVLH